jgi:predicted 3-demethylubiquinone-9 3-methyltransferase (glyoxalase superfamily)
MKNPLMVCLWFDGQAKAAAEFYSSVFKDAKITSENPMVVTFEINGSKFMGLNGGPHFKFNEAISLVVNCDTQEEIDYHWEKLTANGGEESMCGWLKDKFGVSWQIVPSMLGKLMSDPERGQRAMSALMKMKKLDIEKLKNA